MVSWSKEPQEDLGIELWYVRLGVYEVASSSDMGMLLTNRSYDLTENILASVKNIPG